jgi:hypothetical protein
MSRITTKLIGIGLFSAVTVMVMALPASAKWRRLTPADNCSMINNNSDLEHYTGGWIRGTTSNEGWCVCGIPNEVCATPCHFDYDSSSFGCLELECTSTAGEVTISWDDTALGAWDNSTYLGWTSTVQGYIYSGDFLRLIYLSD